ETVEMAFAAAYKKEYCQRGEIIRAKFNPDTGDLKFSKIKLVVDESMIKEPGDIGTQKHPEDEKKVRFNPDRHIMLSDAQKIKPGILPGEELEFPLQTKEEFGRIASQTAKQVILQRIHEAERETIFEEYKSKEGEAISGTIQRVEGRNVFVDLGKTIALMPADETIPGERYHTGERMKFYVLAVEQNPKGPAVFLSRSHPKFVTKLFSLEVPEVAEGIVEIKAISREPGSRTKIAVASNDEAIDPIGACVGQKGTRVAAVINELGGEKIDIINWSDDPAKFIENALLPAKVLDVQIRPGHEARVFVMPDQLSLAIGKGGQNVRLAARLTGWKIEVRSSTKPEEVVEGGIAEVVPEEVGKTPKLHEELLKIPGIGTKTLEILKNAGFDSPEKIISAGVNELTKIKGIGTKTAEKIIESINNHLKINQ
ncbi:MAG: transcription termination factor NusA, partial [Candidatus Paceibacteria bacterium]